MRHVGFHFQPLIKLSQIRSIWDNTSPSLLRGRRVIILFNVTTY